MRRQNLGLWLVVALSCGGGCLAEEVAAAAASRANVANNDTPSDYGDNPPAWEESAATSFDPLDEFAIPDTDFDFSTLEDAWEGTSPPRTGSDQLENVEVYSSSEQREAATQAYRNTSVHWASTPRLGEFDLNLAKDLTKFSNMMYVWNGENGTVNKSSSPVPSITYKHEYRTDLDYAVLAEGGNDSCILGFRGTTAEWRQWIGAEGNLQFSWKRFKKSRVGGGTSDEDTIAYVHSAFLNVYNKYRTGENSTHGKMIKDVRECLGTNKKLILTGHSRGGALANIMALHFALDEHLDFDDAMGKIYDLSRFRQPSSKYLSVYTFGEPRSLSTGALHKMHYDERVLGIRKFRLLNDNDTIISVPPAPYVHVGVAIRIGHGRLSQVKDNNFPKKLLTLPKFEGHYMNSYEQSMLEVRTVLEEETDEEDESTGAPWRSLRGSVNGDV